MTCSNSRLRHYGTRLSTIVIEIKDVLADHDRTLHLDVKLMPALSSIIVAFLSKTDSSVGA